MKIIKPSFEIIDQQAGIDGLLKHLESAGGTCCKSEDGNTACSPKEFAERMIKSGRVDLLEHGTVYLATRDHLNRWRSAEYKTNHSSRVVEENPNLPIEEQTLYITTDFRTLVEKHRLDDLTFLCAPTEFHKKRVTVRFLCDRVTSEAFDSFSRESAWTRMSSKGTFDSELLMIQPPKIDDKDLDGHEYWWGDTYDDAFIEMCDEFVHREITEFDALDIWYYHLLASRWCYQQLVKRCWSSQQASCVLPLDMASPLVVTAYVDDWKRFFDEHGNSSENPEARELLIPLRDEFVKRGLLEV